VRTGLTVAAGTTYTFGFVVTNPASVIFQVVIGSSAMVALAYSRQVFLSKLRNRTQQGLVHEMVR